MRQGKLISVAIKSLILLIAVGALFYVWHAHPKPPAPVGGGDNDEDDVKYGANHLKVMVSVAPITMATLHGYVTAYGTVEPAPATADRPAASADVKTPVAAVVAEVHCIEGQRVEKGQLLFTLDSRAADSTIDVARRRLAAETENFDRIEKMHDVAEPWRSRARRDRDRAQAELDAALAQRALLNFTAPISGTIVQLQIRQGEVMDSVTPAIQIVDLDRLVISASVPGPLLKNIRVGQPADILRSATESPAKAAASTQPAPAGGHVVFIDPLIDPKTGTGSVDVSVEPPNKLRLGELVGVRIAVEEHRDCLTVPTKSLVKNANGEWGVFMAVKDFQWSFRHAVKVGLIDADQAEIEGDGIKAGEFVVTTGANALPDKSRIDVTK